MHPLLSQYSTYVLFPALALGLSWFLTFACIRILPWFGLIDLPGGRHIHQAATPKGGGIAIAIAFFTVWALFLVSPWSHFPGVMDASLFLKLIVPAFSLVGFGLIDDRFGVRARYKLLFQVLLAAFCWYSGIRLEGILSLDLSGPFSLAVTVLWIVGFINAFNLIDGMDGLAAGLAVMTSLSMASVLALRHAPLDMVLLLAFGAACLGFLRYNFHPAKIFLGDAGSMFIGFIFAIVGITAASRGATIASVLIPILAAGVPFFDVVLAVWRRYTVGLLMKIRSPGRHVPGIMDADAEHLHHRILNEQGNYRRSTLILYALSAASAVIAILMQIRGDREAGLTLILLILVAVAVVRRVASVEMWNTTMVIAEGLRRPPRGVLATMVHPFYDLTVLILMFMATAFLFSREGLPAVIKSDYPEMLYCVFPIVVLLHIGGIYRRCWVRACGREYIYLTEIMLVGNVIAAIIRYNVQAPAGIKIFLAFHGFFFLSASAFILSERVGLRVLRNSVIKKNLYLRRFGLKNLPKVLIYGGGQCCYFYLYNHHRNIESKPLYVIGIMDDHPVLQGQYVHGYQVFGGSQMLSQIHADHRFDRLVITCEIDDLQKKREILDFCRSHGVLVSEFLFHESDVAVE